MSFSQKATQAGKGTKASNFSPSIFISHSHKDGVAVKQIHSFLLKLGMAPYATSHDRKEHFQVEIEEKLKNCDVFLLVASKDAFASRWVRREVFWADQLGKPITYYRLDESPPAKGFTSILIELQFIQADSSNNRIDLLGEDVLVKSGSDLDSARTRVHSLIRLNKHQEISKYNEWREELWLTLYDYTKGRRKSSLSKFDEATLNLLANQLGISPSLDKERKEYKRNKKIFVQSLQSAFSKRKLDSKAIEVINDTRIKCCITKAEASSTITNLQSLCNKAKSIRINELTLEEGNWLVDIIKEIQRSKPSLDHRHDANELSSANFLSGKSVPNPPQTNIRTIESQDFPSDYLPGDSNEVIPDLTIHVSQGQESDQESGSTPQSIPEAQSPLSSLNDQIDKAISSLRGGSDKLFRTVEYYESNPVATQKALRNHGLQNHGVERIYVFANTSRLRAKNGILLCDDILSVKGFWGKPIHFDLYSPLEGILNLEARLEKGGTLHLTVRRATETAGHSRKDGIILQTFKMTNLGDEILRPPNKYLIEVELPALVRDLALVRKKIHETYDSQIISTEDQCLPRVRSSDLDASMVIHITSSQAINGDTQRLKIETGESVERLEVKIPPKVSDGARLRLKGKGKFDRATGIRGDLYLIILIQK